MHKKTSCKNSLTFLFLFAPFPLKREKKFSNAWEDTTVGRYEIYFPVLIPAWCDNESITAKPSPYRSRLCISVFITILALAQERLLQLYLDRQKSCPQPIVTTHCHFPSYLYLFGWRHFIIIAANQLQLYLHVKGSPFNNFSFVDTRGVFLSLNLKFITSSC